MFTIDLNNPAEFTFENVRRLIASGDNLRQSQMMIADNGILSLAYDDDIYSSRNDFLGTLIFEQCNRCLGRKAALDDDWINNVYGQITATWDRMKYGGDDLIRYQDTGSSFKIKRQSCS